MEGVGASQVELVSKLRRCMEFFSGLGWGRHGMEIEGHEAEWMNDMNERAIPKVTLSDYYVQVFNTFTCCFYISIYI